MTRRSAARKFALGGATSMGPICAAMASLIALLALSPRPAAAEVAWQDLPAVKQLYERAKPEKEVVIWAPVAGEFDWIEAAFSKRFPGIAIRGTGDLQAATHNFVYSLLYAKAFVQQAELPKTWDELLDPRWRGKLVAQDFLLPRLMG